MIYFLIKFQNKSFKNSNINRVFRDIYNLFPLKDCIISFVYTNCNPLNIKFFNYKQTAFSESDSEYFSDISLACCCNSNGRFYGCFA